MFNELDVNKEYFYISMHFVETPEDFGLQKIDETEYVHKITGEKYYYSESYDTGYGKENGYILDRNYTFDDLIKLALVKSNRLKNKDNNNFGAIDFIMEGTARQSHFRKQFIDFTKQAVIENNCAQITDYFQYFIYHSIYDVKTGIFDYTPGGLYLEQLRKYEEWRNIESLVLDKLHDLFVKWYSKWKKLNEQTQAFVDKYKL